MGAMQARRRGLQIMPADGQASVPQVLASIRWTPQGARSKRIPRAFPGKITTLFGTATETLDETIFRAPLPLLAVNVGIRRYSAKKAVSEAVATAAPVGFAVATPVPFLPLLLHR